MKTFFNFGKFIYNLLFKKETTKKLRPMQAYTQLLASVGEIKDNSYKDAALSATKTNPTSLVIKESEFIWKPSYVDCYEIIYDVFFTDSIKYKVTYNVSTDSLNNAIVIMFVHYDNVYSGFTRLLASYTTNCWKYEQSVVDELSKIKHYGRTPENIQLVSELDFLDLFVDSPKQWQLSLLEYIATLEPTYVIIGTNETVLLYHGYLITLNTATIRPLTTEKLSKIIKYKDVQK